MNLNKKLLEDLELFDKIIPKIDKTVTIYGSAKLKELFTTLLSDKDILKRRRLLLETIIEHDKSRTVIKSHLLKIKKVQDDVTWLFNGENGVVDGVDDFDDLGFKHSSLNTKELISSKNFMKIFSPSIVVVVYLIMYLIYRYHNVISLKDYFSSIYNGYKYFVSTFLSLLMTDQNLVSFLTNIVITTYALYQIYTIYNSIDSSVSHYHKCQKFKSRFKNIRLCIDNIKKIYKADVFFKDEKMLVEPKLNEMDSMFKNVSSVGKNVLLKKDVANYEVAFNSLLQYVGLIDAFINISEMTLNNFTFPEFTFDSAKPSIQALELWSPLIDSNLQVPNDCFMEDNNIMVITGPNTSGKTTYIVNVMLAVLFAQTIGVTCCQYLQITPFYDLFTYVNIPNVSRDRESLFEAELLRCLEFYNILKAMPEDKFVFTIMDELFTGTTPKESAVTSYTVCEHIKNYNCLAIITTHYIELTHLANVYPDKFINMKFSIRKANSKGKNSTFSRSYRIEKGVSDQELAVELMHQKGFDDEIINKAMGYLAGT